MAKHATLGASNASRWINCPGSVRLIKTLPKSSRDNSSSYADEGSAAHKLGERCLTKGTDAAEYLGKSITYNKQKFPIDEDMADAVQVYVDEIRGQIRAFGPLASWALEKSVRPIPENRKLFGTADAIVCETMIAGEIIVTDYKHGAGVVVEIDENDQAMYYALGALRENPEADKITIKIVQPRAPHPDGPVRSQIKTAAELLEYAGVLQGAAGRTEDPDAPLKMGAWCRWCPMNGAMCPEINRAAAMTVREDFSDLISVEGMDDLPKPKDAVNLPDPEDLESLGKAYLMLPYLEYFIKNVLSMSANRLQSGKDFPVAKFVQGRQGNREWPKERLDEIETDAQSLADAMGDDAPSMWQEPKLLSPTQLAKVKVAGDLPFADFVAKNCTRSDGKMTLVPANDPRPAVPMTTARDDFADLLDDGNGAAGESGS